MQRERSCARIHTRARASAGAENRAICRDFREWRDPDSNRGHHEFPAARPPRANVGFLQRNCQRLLRRRIPEDSRTFVAIAALSGTRSRTCAHEAAALITNDSDLAEPLALARKRFGLTTGILQPVHKGRHPSRKPEADFYRRTRSGARANSQFPDVLHDARGAIHRPKRWSRA